jgi:ATP-binding cassette subfamily F protein 3
VSHDRYFVEKLATRIIEIGHGGAVVYPGTYSEFLWSKAQGVNASPKAVQPPVKVHAAASKTAAVGAAAGKPQAPASESVSRSRDARHAPSAGDGREERKRAEAERKKKQRAAESLQKRIADLESRIAERETQVKELEATMSAPGFYENRDASRHIVDRHQALMWEVGDLMAQWEALQEHASES